jgi:hypothetical protein
MVLGLCERFGCLPEALYETDSELLRLVHIEALGRPKDETPAGG